MKAPISIYINSVERLFNDGIISKEEYEKIMLKIISIRAEEGVVLSGH